MINNIPLLQEIVTTRGFGPFLIAASENGFSNSTLTPMESGATVAFAVSGALLANASLAYPIPPHKKKALLVAAMTLFSFGLIIGFLSPTPSFAPTTIVLVLFSALVIFLLL